MSGKRMCHYYYSAYPLTTHGKRKCKKMKYFLSLVLFFVFISAVYAEPKCKKDTAHDWMVVITCDL